MAHCSLPGRFGTRRRYESCAEAFVSLPTFVGGFRVLAFGRFCVLFPRRSAFFAIYEPDFAQAGRGSLFSLFLLIAWCSPMDLF